MDSRPSQLIVYDLYAFTCDLGLGSFILLLDGDIVQRLHGGFCSNSDRDCG